MNDWQEFLLNLLAYLVMGGLGIVIAAAALAAAPYFWRRPLPLVRLRLGRWTGREVLFALVASAFLVPFMVLTLLVPVSGVPERGNKEELRRAAGHLIIWGSPLTVALTLAVVITVLYTMSRTRPHDLGITWARWPANVALGVLMYLAATVPILSVHYLVTQLPGTERHLFERLVEDGMPGWEWGLLVFMTVAGAPLVEELVYRGVFQGWLRRASLVGHGVVLSATLSIGIMPLVTYLSEREQMPERSLVSAIAPLVFGWVLAGGYAVFLYLLWMRAQESPLGAPSSDQWLPWGRWPWPASAAPVMIEADDIGEEHEALRLPPIELRDPAEEDRRRLAGPAALLSVWGSAMVWSMMHYDAWPAPIPLFLLGLALGWLALRTQSLIGPMVCHGLFNSVACLALWWST